MTAIPDYSIVIPVYFNEGSLASTLQDLRSQVIERNPGRRGEVVFVDDGSGDGSLAELLRLQRDYPALVRVIKLTRNFGQVNALLAGFAQARGRCVVFLSADGQDPPHLIHDMLEAHFEEGYEIVAGARAERYESYFRIITSRMFYSLMRRLAFPEMPLGGFDFVLLGRRALQVLLEHPEAHPFLQGQILWLGYPVKFLSYRRQERKVGVSRWTLGRKVTYLVDGVMSYSFLPIRLISVIGILAACFGFLYAILILIIKLVWGLPVRGWAPVMITILVMGGVQMLMLGVIGEYIWRTLAQTRHRPPYVVDRVYDDTGVGAGKPEPVPPRRGTDA
jgi:glycosyltransferase involved in cell wall biosynthesis